MGVRVTQEPVEVVEAPTSAQVRVTQEPVEVVEAPTTAKVRATQIVVEYILKLGGKQGFWLHGPVIGGGHPGRGRGHASGRRQAPAARRELVTGGRRKLRV